MFILREKTRVYNHRSMSTTLSVPTVFDGVQLAHTAYSMTERQQRVLFAILSRADKLVIKDKKVYDAFKGASEQ